MPSCVPPTVIVGDCEIGCRRVARCRLGETKVEDFHDAIRGDLDIGGLQIAVDDSLFVRRLERVCNLPRYGQRFVERWVRA